jgi:putative membrane protein
MTYIIIRTISVLITSYITKVGVPIVLAWSTGATALAVALVLAVINNTIKPVISGLALPITILTLGLFSLVINGAMIALAALIVPGFSIPSFALAIVFSIVLSLVNWVLHVFE